MLILSVFGLVSLVQANSIFFDDIKTLTFYGDQMTTRLRTPPTPQLKCVGGTAKCSFQPQIVECANHGSGTSNWQCKSTMDSDHRFARVEVVCEGYGRPNDDFVRVGSCGLEYTIDDGGTKLVGRRTWKYFFLVITCLLTLYILKRVIFRLCQQRGEGKVPIKSKKIH